MFKNKENELIRIRKAYRDGFNRGFNAGLQHQIHIYDRPIDMDGEEMSLNEWLARLTVQKVDNEIMGLMDHPEDWPTGEDVEDYLRRT